MKPNSIEIKAATPVNNESEYGATPRINLSTAEDVRREMARVYRETRCKKILANEGTKLVYILTQILKATEVYVLEERLSALELTNLRAAR